MELPPGWRGYGAKDYIDHPDTPKRAAEIEALKQQMADAPRFAVQEALMPYDVAAAGALPRPQRTDRRTAGGGAMNDAGVKTIAMPRCPAATAVEHDGAAPQARDQRPALQPAGSGERAAHADLRARGSRRHDAVHRAQRNPREAGRVAAIRLRLPRRHLRQLRDGDQRTADARVPDADQEPRPPRSRWRRCRSSS